MADERYIFRAKPKPRSKPEPAQKPPAAPPPQKPPMQKTPTPQAPKPAKPPRKPRRKLKPIVPLLGLALLAVAICAVVALVSCQQGPTGPATPDFGTPAAPWEKNDLGYYFNESGEPIPAAVLKGIDVSKYQGEVDWEKAKAAGIDFAILRCGFGGEWDGVEAGWNQDDAQWRRNADECTRLGIPFGVYLYSYARDEEEARSEADHVARLLGLTAPPQEGLEDYTAAPYQLSYPVYYDLEDKYITGIFPEEMAAVTAAFFERLQSYGYAGKQGLYASLNWVRGRFDHPAFDPWRENLWIARFADELGYTGTYDMWQSSYTAPGADYGVQSETVDIDFVMRPFTITGIGAGQGKTVDPRFVNDTRGLELQLDAKDARATLTTNAPAPQPDEKGKTQPAVYWTTSDKAIATVNKEGLVLAKAPGECTVTATLADGTESVSCLVRVGDINVPIFATGSLHGARSGDGVSLADVAALKASTQDAVLLDAGGSLHGTPSASLTGGMDVFSAFSSAGYDLHAFGAEDLAYGIARLRSDANVAVGPSLAANLRDAEGAAIFYRSTSWNRNRITNGMNYTIQRAGYTIGFFALADADTVTRTVSLVKEQTPLANAVAQTAAEQVAALQAQGADTILCIATPGVDAAALKNQLQSLGVTAIIDGGAAQSDDPMILAAGNGLNSVGCLTLTFTPDGRVSAAASQLDAAALKASQAIWEQLEPAEQAEQAESEAQSAAESDPEADTKTDEKPQAEPTAAELLQQKGAASYRTTTEALTGLDAANESVLNTPLFDYAQNPDAERTVSFANYVASLYQTIAENDRASLPEADATLELLPAAGGIGELEYGGVTRRAMMEALPANARIQLVRTDAATAKALAEGGTVTRPYLDSLVEFAPAGDTVLLISDSTTLAALPEGSCTLLRDYGDLFWAVRMDINDVTANFVEPFILPEAPVLGAGRGN